MIPLIRREKRITRQLTSQKFIFKIHSSRLKRAQWNLNLSLPDAVKNDEVIKLSDSQVMRFINLINHVTQSDIDEEINSLRLELKRIIRQPRSIENRKKIKNIYARINKIQFVPEYICLIIDSVKDYEKACKGFILNGIKYRRFVGTTNGVKDETIVFVAEKNSDGKIIYDDLCRRVNNGRKQDVPHVPAKFEAYKSLSCSSSTPVSHPNGVLVVKDCITQFVSDYIKLDDSYSSNPAMTLESGELITLNASDGFGLITPTLAQRWSTELKEDYVFGGACIRNSYCKGMVFPFDFQLFADLYCGGTYIVTDIWGNKHDIRQVEIILTESMLKLWNSYDSLEHYLGCCENNGYSFAVTKITPKTLDNTRNLNYQFIQSYDLTDDEIAQLAAPTINEIKSVLGEDIDKSILFLKGMFMNGDSVSNLECDFIKALMIEPLMMNDPFVRSRIYQMIKKRMRDAKTGKIRVNGNFSILSGDPFALCQSIFGLPITGLLNAGECYSKYWGNKNENEVACFRAPMTCHNNIRILSICNSETAAFWYQYMSTVFIINAWDMTMAAENGADMDGDMFFTTNNTILINKTRLTSAIQCIQRTATKQVITEESLIKANINSFGDEIGITTNHVTSMFDVMAKFHPGSEEYQVLDYRIKCGQLFQQNAIDRAKGIVANPMPKEWYDRNANKIIDSDTDGDIARKEFNLTILADKKPYFMSYIYPGEKIKYSKYVSNSNKRCLFEFQIPLNDLLIKDDKSEREREFVNYYYKHLPLGVNRCVVNRLCWVIENEFNYYLSHSNKKYPNFDYSILKSNVKYNPNIHKKVLKLYNEYSVKLQEYSQRIKVERVDQLDASAQKGILKDEFKKQALIICPNVDELCDIVLDLCYSTNKSKQFAWDICGETIIGNLLRKNNYTIKYLIKDDEGAVEFCGEHFSVEYKQTQMEDAITTWQ